MELEEKERLWLIKHFKHTKNSEIMQRLNLTRYRLHKYARELGLTKSRNHIKKVAKENSDLAHVILKEMGWPPKGYVIPNQEKRIEKLRARKGIKRKKASIEKFKETMKEIRKSESRRVLFGLEQKTNIKVTKAPRRKIHIRSKMRGFGYHIEKGSNFAFCDSETARNKYFENEAKKYGIVVVFRKMENG